MVGPYFQQLRNKINQKAQCKKKLAGGGICTPTRHLVVKAHILCVSHRHNLAHFQYTLVWRHAPLASLCAETENFRIRVCLSTVAIFGNARSRCRCGTQGSLSALNSDFAFQRLERTLFAHLRCDSLWRKQRGLVSFAEAAGLLLRKIKRTLYDARQRPTRRSYTNRDSGPQVHELPARNAQRCVAH